MRRRRTTTASNKRKTAKTQNWFGRKRQLGLTQPATHNRWNASPAYVCLNFVSLLSFAVCIALHTHGCAMCVRNDSMATDPLNQRAYNSTDQYCVALRDRICVVRTSAIPTALRTVGGYQRLCVCVCAIASERVSGGIGLTCSVVASLVALHARQITFCVSVFVQLHANHWHVRTFSRVFARPCSFVVSAKSSCRHRSVATRIECKKINYVLCAVYTHHILSSMILLLCGRTDGFIHSIACTIYFPYHFFSCRRLFAVFSSNFSHLRFGAKFTGMVCSHR